MRFPSPSWRVDRVHATAACTPYAAAHLARLQREAEVLASLNHRHITHVYSIDANAFGMQFVTGEDLSQRIAVGTASIDEALPILARRRLQ